MTEFGLVCKLNDGERVSVERRFAATRYFDARRYRALPERELTKEANDNCLSAATCLRKTTIRLVFVPRVLFSTPQQLAVLVNF